MKKFFILALCLLSVSASAQGILERFYDPEAEKVVFLEKGSRTFGISGNYRSFNVGGDGVGDGFSVLSMLNIGTGRLATYKASPKFSYLLADDLSLGFRLDYSGYTMNSDLRLDLRSVVDVSGIADNPEDEKEIQALLNLQISNRHMVNNTWGVSFTLRKYIPFFGSKAIAVFGEARLYGNYATTLSCPIDYKGGFVTAKQRTNNAINAGLKIAGGLCVRVRGDNAVFVSVPLIGATYSNTLQHKNQTNNNAHLSQFKIARDLDFLGVQVGYMHCVKPKSKSKKK